MRRRPDIRIYRLARPGWKFWASRAYGSVTISISLGPICCSAYFPPMKRRSPR